MQVSTERKGALIRKTSNMKRRLTRVLRPAPKILLRHDSFFFFLNFKTLFIYLFIYLFLAVLGLRFARGLSPAAASGGHPSSRCGDRSSSRCAGLSLLRPLPSRGTGSRRAGSAIVAHGPSRSAACGILPDQGPNPCPLHQQADPQPLRHQGSPRHDSF